MGAMIAITVMLASSSVAFAQNGKQAPQKAKAQAASNKPFDAHDLSGFWDITNIGRPPGALNETSNNRPPMTPWGLEKFHMAKTGYDGKALGNGVYREKKIGMILSCCVIRRVSRVSCGIPGRPECGLPRLPTK